MQRHTRVSTGRSSDLHWDKSFCWADLTYLDFPHSPRIQATSFSYFQILILRYLFMFYLFIFYFLFLFFFGQIVSSTYSRSVGSQCCCAAGAMFAGATFCALKSQSHRNQSYFLGYTLVSLILLITSGIDYVWHIRLACVSKCQSQKYLSTLVQLRRRRKI